VIASNIPVHREVLQEAGRFVPPHDADEIAKTIYQVLMDRELNTRLRTTAIQRAKDFSWEKTASRTIQVYEEAWARSHERA
jgi:glycosyltransferase involved in cell wall biosynthesis